MKAVLVIDTPNDCDVCPLNSHTEYDFDVCWVTQGKGGCPLRQLPEWKDVPEYLETNRDWEAWGYDQCLTEILGDAEGETE